MSILKLNKSRRGLLWILAAFAVPVVLAKLALDYNWLNKAATNKGELLPSPLALEQVGISDRKLNHKWLIIYRMPARCEARCALTLYGMNQTYIALGKEIDRVLPVGYYAKQPDSKILSRLRTSAWYFRPATLKTTEALKSDKVYLVDPLGNIIMSYPTPQNDKEVITFGKAILSDLLKLLKYSKLG
jgi:cytochrome oxidase Cu insertion factor (SCO1/SenC/PrrC family)